MTTTTTVPFTITDEAVALLRELGLQKEFEQIIEQLKQFVPGLLNIRTGVMTMYDEGNRQIVLIECEMLDRQLEDDPTQRDWGEVFIPMFPAEVREHFGVLIFFGGPNAVGSSSNWHAKSSKVEANATGEEPPDARTTH